jgi:hypothetical protein
MYFAILICQQLKFWIIQQWVWQFQNELLTIFFAEYQFSNSAKKCQTWVIIYVIFLLRSDSIHHIVGLARKIVDCMYDLWKWERIMCEEVLLGVRCCYCFYKIYRLQVEHLSGKCKIWTQRLWFSVSKGLFVMFKKQVKKDTLGFWPWC